MRKKAQKNFLSKEEAKRFDEETLKSQVPEKEVLGEVDEEVKPSLDQTSEQKENSDISFDEALKGFKLYSDMETVLRSSLLGYFEGEDYKIKKEVAKELLKLPKIIDEQTVGTIVCHALYKDYTFKFYISYDNFTTYSSARIYLLEEKDNVDGIETLKTLIGDCVQPGGKDIAEFLITEWNLKKASNNGDGEDGQDQELNISELDSVLLGIKTDYVFNKELMEVLSQIYVIRMIALLGKCGQDGEKILSEYNKLLKEFAIKRPSILLKYAMMKHVLDSVIIKNNGIEILRKENEKEFQEVMVSFYEPLKKINVRYFEGVEVAYPSIERAKKPSETTKSSSKKPAEKGEKPYYIKTADAPKIDPYKYGAVPKMPEAGGSMSPTEKKEVQNSDTVENKKEDNKLAPKIETETKLRENEDNVDFEDPDFAKDLFRETVNPLEKVANQLEKTGESLEEDTVKGKTPPVKPPEPYL